MTIERTIQIVQMAFPQIYLACHTRHQRKRTTAHGLSARDSAILAHLDEREGMAPAGLARHLGVARSTLSEAVKHLAALGYVRQVPRPGSKGSRGGAALLLTPRGAAAIRDTSVLETPRLREALRHLTPAELRLVARGLGTLAGGCRRVNSGEDAGW
jgi:DNA-binding MarR family transcriptional regulator